MNVGYVAEGVYWSAIIVVMVYIYRTRIRYRFARHKNNVL